MDSYRIEKRAVMKIDLEDKDAEIAPVPTEAGGRKPEPELDRLSNILKAFNEQFGTSFADSDRIIRHIIDDIAPKVAADAAYQNARAEHPAHRPFGTHRPGAWQGSTGFDQGFYPVLQAVRREGLLSTFCK
jgi:hypothetical protein